MGACACIGGPNCCRYRLEADNLPFGRWLDAGWRRALVEDSLLRRAIRDAENAGVDEDIYRTASYGGTE